MEVKDAVVTEVAGAGVVVSASGVESAGEVVLEACASDVALT